MTPHDLLLIQFTSGTTAYPKAVMLTHDNMLRNAWAVGPAHGHPCRRPLLQLPAVLPRRRHDAVAAGLADRRRLPGDAADVRGRRRARHDGARTLHADLRQRHAVPADDGTPRASIRRSSACAAAGRRPAPRPCATSSRRWARATSASPTACRKPRRTSCSTTTATTSNCASPASPSRSTASRCASWRTAGPSRRPAKPARSKCAAGT